jgi:hypothetical protein
MRGSDERSGELFSYVDLGEGVPRPHVRKALGGGPLRSSRRPAGATAVGTSSNWQPTPKPKLGARVF